MQIGVAELASQQLCGAANATQRIFYLVRHAFHDLLQCGLCLPFALVTADGLQTINHGQLDQKTPGVDFPRNGTQRQINGPLLSHSSGERNCAAHHGVVVGQRLVEEWVPFVGFIK